MRRASTYSLAGNSTPVLGHREEGVNELIYRRFSLPARRRHDESMKIAEMKAQTFQANSTDPDVLPHFVAAYLGLNRAQVATSILQQRANDVRANRVNWQSYLQGQMISNEDFQFISKFDNATADMRQAMLQEQQNKHQLAKTFFNLMSHIAKDQTLQYILTMLDDVLQEDKTRVEILKQYSKRNKESVWTPFLHLLDRNDRFIVNQTSRIIAKIACWSKDSMDHNDLKFYLNWLKDQLRQPGNEYLQTAARCLQMMLRINTYREMFVQVDGIPTILSVLAASKVGFQIQYQLTFCLWCLTFNSTLIEKMNKYSTIPILSDILSDSVKEKVSRIILATFRNLLEKPEEKETVQENALAMVQCKVLKQLELLEARKFDDPDIIDDLEFLQQKLQESVQDLSSFDEYVTEVKSGRLEWSPVHKSDRFWRENAMRLNEKNYELLKILVRLLEGCKDPLILSVAAHDIGEYVRYYPRGKIVIEQLGAKQLVMQYLSHEDPNVRYEALIAVQKLMVHNWEYLGKQISQSRTDTNDEQPAVVQAKA